MPPAGGGYGDFFPAAPRAAKVKAQSREISLLKAKVVDSPVREATGSDPDSWKASPVKAVDQAVKPLGRNDAGGVVENVALGTEDNDSVSGDILNAVGSASSHSSTVSSLFSNANHTTVPLGGSSSVYNLTPLTTIDTSPPERLQSPISSKAISSALPAKFEQVSEDAVMQDVPQLSDDTYHAPQHCRVLMRDPTKRIQGFICTRDPILDSSVPADKKKKMKATYKEFGMEDDAPADPRLKRGKLNYINVDFHNGKARLRPMPYLIRPYQRDKHSVGPGPPTEIIVSGFDPLMTFSQVTATFASFGDIAESSNKMHPDTGSYLGFATFRYRDSKSSRTGHSVSAVEAARRAVRTVNNQRIGQMNVKVEFDPEGRKSIRKLEELLKKEDQQAKIDQPQSRPKDANATPGPPPTAPKGPSGRPSFIPRGPVVRQNVMPDVSAYPAFRPKRDGVEETPIGPTLGNKPYLFVSGESVPIIPATIAHMKKRIRHHIYEDVRLDRSGYYIIFSDSPERDGYEAAHRCYSQLNNTKFFTYNMEMTFHNLEKRPAPRRANSPPSRKQRGVSPLRLVDDRQRREDEMRLRKENELDIEEEKRQRAKNLDPAREAVTVIRQELVEQLLRFLKTRTAAPLLHTFLDPSNHEQKRLRLNIQDPDFALPSTFIDDIGDTTPGRTPNSHAAGFQQRAGKIDKTTLAAIGRINKAKTRKQKMGNVKFADPTGRARKPPVRNLFRNLHEIADDEDSEDDTEHRSSARETEEPESRPRSRLGSEDEDSDEEEAAILPLKKRQMMDISRDWEREDDSMTEASVAADVLPSHTKRKLPARLSEHLKRQKFSEEELFGVADDNMHSYSPASRPEEIAKAAEDEEDGQTPELDIAALKRPVKASKKRKSKKQIFEEREAAKRVKEEAEALLQASTPAETVVDTETEGEVLQPHAAEPDGDIGAATASTSLRIAGQAGTHPISDIAGYQNLIDDEIEKQRMIDALLARKTPAKMSGSLEVWAWKRKEANAINMSGMTEASIEGYYVPNSTGCARTEGTKKILNSEKSKYLPHRIKVQKQREERQARATNEIPAVTVAADAAKIEAEKLAAKGNSRANRVNNRRFAVNLSDQKEKLGIEADALKFNQLQKRKKPVKFARSAIHNWGLYTMENIPMNDMIIEYVGEKVRQAVADLRELQYIKSGIGSSYLFRIDDNTVVDATKMGGIARFINHSCMPNCTAKIIKVEGTKRIVIYALRSIRMNEELTYDYKFEREIGSTDRIPCLCGTTACKGFLN